MSSNRKSVAIEALKKSVTVKPSSNVVKLNLLQHRVFTGKKVVISKKPDSSEITCLSDLGEQIKYKRTGLGLSIEKTSSLCGISDKTLRNIESGGDTKVSSVLNIISMLGMTLKLEDK
jgi:predicted transcriptional regulator